MPERRLRRAVLAAAGGLLVAGVAAAPVLAQSEVSDPAEWESSTFTAPFSGRSGTVTTDSFAVAGVIHKDARPLERIVGVDVSFEHADGGQASFGDPCIPASPGAAAGDSSAEGDVATYEFSVPETTWPCNGRYRIVARARSSQELGAYELIGELAVAVPPLPVSSVGSRWDGSVDAVEVVWQPLDEDELATDAVGYRVERAGPGDAPFTPVGPDRGLREETVVLDRPDTGGEYRYRVRAIRSGPDGPIFSPAQGSKVATVTVPGGADASTTTTAPGADRPRPRSGASSGGRVVPGRVVPRVPSPPTTADTGFEETLDYGDRDAPVVDDGDTQALAGQEGQAIIRTDDEGTGLLAPAAGALVLLGWAGHIAYVNRLAKQF